MSDSKMTVYANQLEHQIREQAEEIERLKKERDGAVKQALEQHRIVQDLGRELRAERAQRERLEKAVQQHLMAIGHDAADETDCDVGFGCTLCELSKALRHDAPWLQRIAREALRPAAPEAKESDCTCGEQWPCPLHGGPPSAPEPTPNGADLALSTVGVPAVGSEHPDLPLGHDYEPTAVDACGHMTDRVVRCRLRSARVSPSEEAMTTPKRRTPEEIADEWLRIGPLADADYTGLPDEVYASLLAALREAADAARKEGERDAFVTGAAWWEFHNTGGTIWQSDRRLAEEEAARKYPCGRWAADLARREEREALRDYIVRRRSHDGIGGAVNADDALVWLDARSRSEEPKV